MAITSSLHSIAAKNPFVGELACGNSMYATSVERQLVRLLNPSIPVSPRAIEAHDALVANIYSPGFSCVGAKSAIRNGNYRFSLYGELATVEATAGLACDLYTFAAEQSDSDNPFTTFVASFDGPTIAGEQDFERLLWRQLQCLHDVDHEHHPWDPSVGRDPQQPDFSFSFAGTAFFVVGLFAGSGRWNRRFAWPTMVFNLHRQFELLRSRGQYTRLRDVIRDRELAGQGSVYAMLTDFGAKSEARSYAGRVVEPDWQCPFHAKQEEGASRP